MVMNHNTKNNNDNTFRLKVYTVIVLLLFGVLFVRLWYLQIIQGHQFLVMSEENRIRLLRGQIP